MKGSMKKQALVWLVILVFGLEILSGSIVMASAHAGLQAQVPLPAPKNQVTPLPTDAAITQADATPEVRVLPPVGSNAGLVIGAVVLVLIIIGGVLSARLRPKH
jgi:hypothetical protein